MLHELATATILLLGLLPAASAQSPGTITCEPGLSGVIACPCANNPSGPGRGCNNSLGTGGAALVATGNPSLSADSVVFWSSSIGTLGPSCSTPNQNVLCALYTGQSSITNGIVWGDGVLCCGANYFVLAIGQSTNGDFIWPPPGTSAVSSTAIGLGDPLVAGSTRCYFVAYRDTCPAFCPIAVRQKTNSYRITWLP